MAKTKTPFLSLGASGTVSDTLTYQRRGRDTITRKKPIPQDPYSLNQAYQRWDYRDYAYLWTLLSNSEKQVYRTKASRYHITGFSQFMREQLKTLPDLVARWRLDERIGVIAHDSSKQGNDGVIIGASPATGVISGAYSFDGINDRVTQPALMPPIGTLEFWLSHTIPAGTSREGFFGAFTAALHQFSAENWVGGFSYWGWYRAAINARIATAQAFPSGFFLVHLIWNKTTGITTLYWNNSQVGQNLLLDDSIIVDVPCWMGCINNNGVAVQFGDSIIDNLVIYNRELDDTERQRHLGRGYPL